MSFNSPSRNKKKRKKNKKREEKTYFFKPSGNKLSRRVIRLPIGNSSYINFVVERNDSLFFFFSPVSF